MADIFQFYPTPPSLVERAWRKFKDTNFIRILEPSAGRGDLADGNPGARYRTLQIDCCEINLEHHPLLRSKGYEVIGFDFLKMSSLAQYSHVILNPPFSSGVEHVLHAWDRLFSGEIVAIINAESLRNPAFKERQRLRELVAKHGEVEFIAGAFCVEEAERKTAVDVALIWLKKEADAEKEIFGDLFSELRPDRETGAGLTGDYDLGKALALPSSEIENHVLTFDCAVKSMRDAIVSEARANYYASLLGETMAVLCSDRKTKKDVSVDFVRKEIGKAYADLKDRAWANVLRSTNFTSRLSSKAQRRLESEFEVIKKLDFTTANIYGFLCGLIERQGEIQIDMVLDVFDDITRYHSENTVFYKGWRSNDKHQTAARRIKYSRFILPGFGYSSWRAGLGWDEMRRLADFDRVFAMLDGKREPSFGLEKLFSTRFDELRSGERVASDYFEVRYYGVGTIHFYTTRRDLIDRLNRVVGRQRNWIPPETSAVSPNFWEQFEKAEKFDKEVRAEIKRQHTGSYWTDPLRRFDSGMSDEQANAVAAIDKAITTVLDRHGISTEFLIEEAPAAPALPQLSLLAA